MIEGWCKKKIVFASPLLPFGTVGEANVQTAHLQIALSAPQTRICKRAVFLPPLKEGYQELIKRFSNKSSNDLFFMRRNKKIIMMKKFILLLFISAFFVGCSTKKEINLEGVSFETAEYYDAFLFVPAKSTPTSRKMNIKFNDWAKFNNSHVTLLMSYKDEDDTHLRYFGTENSPFVSVYLNGEPCENGEIRLNTNTDNTLDLQIEFAPEAEEKLYTGYIVVEDAKIDRINNIDNISNQSKVFKWSVRYDIVMNPLKKVLLWFSVFILLSLIVWFVFLRNIFFKKMKKGKIVINKPYSKSIKIAGSRKLVFTAEAKKQKVLNKIFAGKVLYEVNPIWDSEIVFTPKDKRNLRIRTGVNYSIKPYTNLVVRGKSYEIQKGKELIKISFL